MVCPRCHAQNNQAAHFCEECGARLGQVCPTCGQPVGSGKNFCRSCGAQLNAGSSPNISPDSYTPKHLAEKILTTKADLEGERKQVTVVFADLKSSMELLADRDPEEAREFLDSVLAHMMEAVHRYEGTVNQVMGDGIMALFGAPLAHEDHAVRACYAALRMQQMVGLYAEELRRTHGLDAQIRIGVNSGEVVVRSITNDLHMDYSAIGETTHLAARLEQLARPGSSLMTRETRRLTEGYIEAKSLGPMPVKGLTDPLEVFEITGASAARSRLQAAAPSGLTRFVGREAELGQLEKALEQARAGHGQVVAVVGEPGVGKSRLFYEFIRSPRLRDWLTVESVSVSYGRGTAYLAAIELLRRYFKLESGDDIRTIQAKVTGNLLTLDETLKDAIPAILCLLDVLPAGSAFRALDPQQRRQRTYEAIKGALLREARLQPVCLVFEDLHAIDSETEGLLDSLIDSMPTARLLLLVNYRPEYQHSWSGKTYYTQLRMDPLPPETAENLVRVLMGTDSSLRPLTRLLIEKTEGNPFFLEESVRTLIETNVLGGERGAYRLVGQLKAIQVPRTVQAVLAARTDRLAPEDKRLLQSAAVIGNDVPLRLLQKISDLPEVSLRRSLANLQTAGFLYEASLFPELEYTFKHALTHEVTYSGLLQERRRTLHAKIFDALVALHDGRLEPVERLGHHAFGGQLWNEAVDYLSQAAERALTRSANREAVAYAEQASVALGHLPQNQTSIERAIDLHLHLRSALLPLQELERVGECLAEAARLAALIPDERRLARIAGFAAGHEYLTGKPLKAIEHGNRAAEIAARLGEPALEIVPNIYLAQASHARGDNRRAVELLTRNLVHLGGSWNRERFGMPGLATVISRSWLVIALAELGEFTEALRYAREAKQLSEKTREPFDEIHVNTSIAFLHLRQGDFPAAIPLAQAAIAECQLHDLPHMWNVAVSHLGYAFALSGRVGESLPLLQAAVQQSTEKRVQAAHSLWQIRLAEGYLFADRVEEAVALAESALERTRAHGERGYEGYALRILAEARARAGSAATAEDAFRCAGALAQECGLRPLLAHCQLGAGKLHLALGRTREAAADLAAAADLYRTLRMIFWLPEAETALTAARGALVGAA